MKVYCLEDFKAEFDKLKSNKYYSTLEQEIISCFFNKTTQELCSGTRLNNSDKTPYIKKRLGGRGGFRCYFLLIIAKDSLYLMYVHLKTGSKGIANITDESKEMLYKKVLTCIKSNNLYQLELSDNQTKILFNKLVPAK